MTSAAGTRPMPSARGIRRSEMTAFITCAEYLLKYGATDDATFVRILYRNFLLREPAQWEVDFQVANCVIPLGRLQMAQNFLYSAEFQQLLGPRMTAFLSLLSWLIWTANSAL